MHKAGKVELPPELFHYRSIVEQYVESRIREFAVPFGYKLNPGVPIEQLLQLAADTLQMQKLSHMPPAPTLSLRLVLKHDCESSGCGDVDCSLCQFNPNRLCKRNLKQKYLIDDNLKAKCNANVRVEINDEQGRLHPHDLILEVNVLSWDKYKEVSSQSQLLAVSQLRSCFVQNAQKSLLRREGNKDHDEQRVVLQLERGSANLSELQVTTSSEALLSGKAPGFMLLIWAVDVRGEPLSGIQYVVSEKFVVTTKRVKQAIKSDIPSVDQHVSKLVHVGRATVDKLNDLRQAAQEEQIEIDLPDDLCCVERVGQFQKLVEMADVNSDFKQKLLKLLKLSPEKWEELCQHALAAVVPDFRPRIWTHPDHNLGLLFTCKHGAALLDNPVALIQPTPDPTLEDKAVPIQQLEPNLRDTVTQLRRQAKAAWYQPTHPYWSIYWKTSDAIQQLLQAQGASQADTLTEVGDAATPALSNATKMPSHTPNAHSPVSQPNSAFSPPTTPQIPGGNSNMHPSNPASPSPMQVKSTPGSPLGVTSTQLPKLFPPDASHQSSAGVGLPRPGLFNTESPLTPPPTTSATTPPPTHTGIASSTHTPSGSASGRPAGGLPPAKRQQQQPTTPSPFTQESSIAMALAQQQRNQQRNQQGWDLGGGRPPQPPQQPRPGGLQPANRQQQHNTPSPFASNDLQQQMFTTIAPVTLPPQFEGPARNHSPESFALQLASVSGKMPTTGGPPAAPDLGDAPPSLGMLTTEELRLLSADAGAMNWTLNNSAAIPSLSTIFNSSGVPIPSSSFDPALGQRLGGQAAAHGDHAFANMIINPNMVNANLSLKLSEMSLDLVDGALPDGSNLGQAKAY